MDAPRRVTPGRLRRLTEELLEEQIGVIERSSMPDVLVDEIDYALRPPRHERRVPSYGSFVLPEQPVESWSERTGLDVVTSATTDAVDDEVRRYADGLVSWTIRTASGVDSLVVFDRPAGSERDLVVLADVSHAMVVQRHPSGEIRLAGSFGVARWDGLGWHVEPPVDTWLPWATCGLGDVGTEALDQLMRFAVHDLGSRGVGALLVFAPSDDRASARERRLPHPPPLRIGRPTDLGPLRHVLTQVDGAALFDSAGELSELGVRLVPSASAESAIGALGGTRHTSGRRYSYDDPDAVVIVVSESGPVTVFRRGDVVGHSPDAD
ncbi:MAG: diadenylate cyclase [Ilumatobacter sp.]|uniref:diadenylate cyclase n=1 Tax=Ilumatobacter sp. TaxID=1967498 RepID=UPI0026265C44|nr:diadenylate cyclase [Ilumatobacter sp.]MDJ0768110.1 diadenylate cyclase [Ilumatobacter sp.]